jgi:hypothetical protein
VILSPDNWSSVIEIRNEKRHPAYPAITYALVFEFNQVLWLYTPYDGTQSLSFTYGTTKTDRQNLMPLLKNKWPGFAHFRESVMEPEFTTKGHEHPANACFIEAIAALDAIGVPRSKINRAALLVIYFQNRDSGHTVLSYETEDGRYVYDAKLYPKPIPLHAAKGADPVEMASEAFPGAKIASARFVEFSHEALVSGRHLIAGKAGEDKNHSG